MCVVCVNHAMVLGQKKFINSILYYYRIQHFWTQILKTSLIIKIHWFTIILLYQNNNLIIWKITKGTNHVNKIALSAQYLNA